MLERVGSRDELEQKRAAIDARRAARKAAERERWKQIKAGR